MWRQAPEAARVGLDGLARKRAIAIPGALDKTAGTTRGRTPHAGTPPRRVVHFFVLVLADVADPHRVGRAVEREPPRVPQPVRPDFRLVTRLTDERIVRGNCVRRGAVRRRIDAQNLAEPRVEIL